MPVSIQRARARTLRWSLSMMVLGSVLSVTPFAQGNGGAATDATFEYKGLTVNSGVFDGTKGRTGVVYSARIEEPDVPWMRVYFEEWHLGESSYLTIRSLEDGGVQRLDSKVIDQWGGSSAYFSGDAVEIQLHLAPSDRNVFFRVAGVRLGINRARWSVRDICDEDDRVASNDPAIGRFFRNPGARCTVWITSNGALLTAGHCLNAATNEVAEFNIRQSDQNGNPRPSAPEDQYPVINNSIVWRDEGVGQDWLVFNVAPTLGQMPYQRQNAFYRLARDYFTGSSSLTTPITVTGCGIDLNPPTDNRTQQTSDGALLSDHVEDELAWIVFDTVAESGNSGGPLIWTGEDLSIGILTHGGCVGSQTRNNGTSFKNPALADVVQNFPGANTTYVDAGHSIAAEDGTVFRPFDTVGEGYAAVADGGQLSIVKGTYHVPSSTAFNGNRAVRLSPSVGEVRIAAN